jgi:hypothetical protein
MSKMGSYCSFRHLKHKLWPKEGPGVKLPVWLSTRKSRESTRFTWLWTTCYIPLESFRRELQFCLKSHFDPRFARKVIGLQSHGSARWRDFGPWWVLCVRVACGSSYHQRCSNYALITLCGLCAGSCEWISLSTVPSPISELQHAPLALKVLWARERVPIPPSSAIFHLDSHLSPSRSWECVTHNERVVINTWNGVRKCVWRFWCIGFSTIQLRRFVEGCNCFSISWCTYKCIKNNLSQITWYILAPNIKSEV